MKFSSPFRPGIAVVALGLTALTSSAFAAPFHAIHQAGPPGKVRPQQPVANVVSPPPPVRVTPVQVTVSQFSKPVSGISVTFKTSLHSVAATTNNSGVASIRLLPGFYTVTASSGGKSATTKIHVVAGAGSVGATLSIPGE